MDDPGVCLSVSLSVARACCAKTTERIDVALGVETHVNPRSIVLGVSAPMASGRGFDETFSKSFWLLVNFRPLIAGSILPLPMST